MADPSAFEVESGAPEPARPDLLFRPGDRLGRWQIRGLLGRGAQGIVYQARNGEYFRVNRRGERRFIDVVIEYPRWRWARPHDRRWRYERRGWRDYPHRRHPY